LDRQYSGIRTLVEARCGGPLRQRAIRSVQTAADAKNGITYLIDAIKCGIETPLTLAYRDEILRLTNTPSLDEALKTAARAGLRWR
jgi:hypothetical protein